MHNALCDSILRFVGCTMRLMRILIPLIARNVLQLVCFVLEEFINFLLIFYYALRDYLSMFNETVT